MAVIVFLPSRFVDQIAFIAEAIQFGAGSIVAAAYGRVGSG
jgi:hypothetical protein